MYGTSDWTFEAWVYPLNEQNANESPVLQWARRPGTTCDSAAVGLGNQPS